MPRQRASVDRGPEKKASRSGRKARALRRKREAAEAAENNMARDRILNVTTDQVDDNTEWRNSVDQALEADDNRSNGTKPETKPAHEKPLWGGRLCLSILIVVLAAPVLMTLLSWVLPPPTVPIALPVPPRAGLPPPMQRLSPAELERRMRMVPYLGPYND